MVGDNFYLPEAKWQGNYKKKHFEHTTNVTVKVTSQRITTRHNSMENIRKPDKIFPKERRIPRRISRSVQP